MTTTADLVLDHVRRHGRIADLAALAHDAGRSPKAVLDALRGLKARGQVAYVLRAMAEQPHGEHVVTGLPRAAALATTLREDLRLAGCMRAELHTCASDPPRLWMTMHDLRTTGITWMAVRGDEPLRIMARAGHGEMASTLGYVSRAALVGQAYGAPFPELPADLQSATRSATPTPPHGETVRRGRYHTDAREGQERDRPADSAEGEPYTRRPSTSKPAIPGDGDDSGSRFATAQRARLHALLNEAGRAVDDGDEPGLRRLLGAALAALPSPAAKERAS